MPYDVHLHEYRKLASLATFRFQYPQKNVHIFCSSDFVYKKPKKLNPHLENYLG